MHERSLIKPENDAVGRARQWFARRLLVTPTLSVGNPRFSSDTDMRHHSKYFHLRVGAPSAIMLWQLRAIFARRIAARRAGLAVVSGAVFMTSILSDPLSSAAQTTSIPESWSRLSTLERAERVIGLACEEKIINDMVNTGASPGATISENEITYQWFENQNARVLLSRRWQRYSPPSAGDVIPRLVEIKNIRHYPDIAFLADADRSLVQKLFKISRSESGSDLIYGEAITISARYSPAKRLASLLINCHAGS